MFRRNTAGPAGGQDDAKASFNNLGGKRASGTSTVTGAAAKDGESESSGEVNPKAKYGTVSFFRLFRYATWTDCFYVFIACFAALANGGSMSAYAILLGRIFDSLNSPGGFQNEYAYYLCGLGGAVICLGLLQVGLLTVTADRTTATVRKAYLNALLKQEVSYFDANRSGQLSTAIVENSIVFRESIGEKIGQCIQNVGMFVIGLCVGFYFSWKLAFVTLSLSPLVALTMYFMARTIKQRITRQLQSYADAGSVAEETFLNIRTITSLGSQPQRINRFNKELLVATKISLKQGLMGGVANGLVMAIFFCSYAIAFYAGGTFIVQSRSDAEALYPLTAVQTPPPGVNYTLPSYCAIGATIPTNVCNPGYTPGMTFETAADVCACSNCGCGCFPDPTIFGAGASVACISGGTILTVFFSVLLGAFGIGQAGPALAAISNGRVAAKRIYELIDRKPRIDQVEHGIKLESGITGNITFTDVAFTYPTRPDKPIFKNLSLTITAGNRVGLVGPSGSGKSTITQLLLRFYDPAMGTVTLDGVDIKTLDMKWYRSRIGLISQEPILFATSIKENVRFGLPGATDEQVIEACKSANAHEFIMEFPEKYDTFVGGAGSSQLSGGQKQRICLARAFIRKPAILIADEATSALDVKSEQIVNASIDGFSSPENGMKCTTIVIAHRLETIRKCDTIIVLEYGVVVEEGTHDSLVERGGVYAALVKIAERRPDDSDKPASKQPSPRDPNRKLVAQVEEAAADEHAADTNTSMVQINLHSDDEGGDKPVSKKAKKPKAKRVPVSRVFVFAYPERWYFIPALGGAAAVGLVFPVFALIFANILNTFYLPVGSDMLQQCATWAGTFVGLAVAVMSAYVTQGTAFGHINGHMTARVRERTFEAMLKADMAYYDDPDNAVGVLTAKLATDASLVKAVVSDRASLFVQDTATLVAGLTIAFVGSWKVALVVFGVFPFMVLGGVIQARAMSGVNVVANSNLAEANQTVSEAVAGIRTVLAFDLMDAIRGVYSEQLKKSLKGYQKNAFVAGFGFGFGQSMRFFVYALALWYGSTLIRTGEITFKDLNQALFGILMSAIALGQALAAAPDIAKGGPAVSSIFSILDRKSTIDWSSPEGEQPSQILGDITFEKVTFSYPTRPGSFALEDFSLKIPRGKTVALVGPSGSGKSTVVALVERFYDPTFGSVKLDGVDLRKLNVAWLRANVGLVSQEPVLMNDSILENIRYGKAGATDEECIEACKDANAHDFVMSLPEQYNTSCGNRGGSLSGGQKQRIAIARALVRRPNILLLDESTSALDEESQKVVQEALDRLLKSQTRTTIIIAHRFSTIRNADTIVVVDHGKVVEQGTYNDLAANSNGAFAALLRSQHA